MNDIISGKMRKKLIYHIMFAVVILVFMLFSEVYFRNKTMDLYEKMYKFKEMKTFLAEMETETSKEKRLKYMLIEDVGVIQRLVRDLVNQGSQLRIILWCVVYFFVTVFIWVAYAYARQNKKILEEKNKVG